MTRTQLYDHCHDACRSRDDAPLLALRDRLLEEWGLTGEEADALMRHLCLSGFTLLTVETCVGYALRDFGDVWRGWDVSRRRRWVLDNPEA